MLGVLILRTPWQIKADGLTAQAVSPFTGRLKYKSTLALRSVKGYLLTEKGRIGSKLIENSVYVVKTSSQVINKEMRGK